MWLLFTEGYRSTHKLLAVFTSSSSYLKIKLSFFSTTYYLVFSVTSGILQSIITVDSSLLGLFPSLNSIIPRMKQEFDPI